jgi:hypothetical protein
MLFQFENIIFHFLFVSNANHNCFRRLLLILIRNFSNLSAHHMGQTTKVPLLLQHKVTIWKYLMTHYAIW